MLTFIAATVMLLLVWREIRRLRSSANVRAVALHVLGQSIPMLEAKGYRPYRKQVSFGRDPYLKYNMESDHGLWIDIWVSETGGYFHLQNMDQYGDEPMNLTHRFEVSGPWDELSFRRVSEIESDFNKWVLQGCRQWESQGRPDDQITFYMPASCLYAVQGSITGSPVDLGYKLKCWMHQARPDQRYPFVPRLPKA